MPVTELLASQAISRRAVLASAVAGVGLAGVPLAAAPAAAAIPTLFVDRFDRTALGPRWEAFNHVVRVRGGALWVTGTSDEDLHTRDGWALTHAGDTAWTDYVYAVRANSFNPGDAAPTVPFMTTLYARVAGTADRAASRDTCYRLDVVDPGQLDPRGIDGVLTHGLLQMWRMNEGRYTLIADSTRTPVAKGINSIRWRLFGPTLEVRVNGRRGLHVVDPEPLTSGGVGVGAIWELTAAFDDVVVSPRDVPV